MIQMAEYGSEGLSKECCGEVSESFKVVLHGNWEES